MPALIAIEMKLKWRLQDVMTRYRVSNRELATKMGKHHTAIARLRTSKELPALKGSEFERIASSITDLLHDREINAEVTVQDLIGFEE